MTMTPRLPLEILYRIFGVVAEINDRPTISSCSLVCQATRYICQGYLFNASGLMFPCRNDEIGRLTTILEANHRLSQCINDISFTIELHLAENRQDGFKPLFRLFDSLTPSRMQHLSFTILSVFTPPAKPISQDFVSRVQKLIIDASPSLEILEAQNRPFPLCFLRTLPALKILKLGGGRILSDAQENVTCGNLTLGGDGTLPNRPLRVEHLRVSGHAAKDLADKDHAQTRSEAILDYDSIRKCSIDMGFVDSIPMAKGILSRVTGLVKLSLAINNKDVRDLLPALQKHVCSTLQTLEASLVVAPTQDNYGSSDMFLGLFRLLAEFPKENALTSLDVSVRMCYQFTSESASLLFRREDWEMPGVVLNASAFPSLKRIKLAYSIVDYSRFRYGFAFVEKLRRGSFEGLRAWVSDVSCAVLYLDTATRDHNGLPVVEEYLVE